MSFNFNFFNHDFPYRELEKKEKESNQNSAFLNNQPSSQYTSNGYIPLPLESLFPDSDLIHTSAPLNRHPQTQPSHPLTLQLNPQTNNLLVSPNKPKENNNIPHMFAFLFGDSFIRGKSIGGVSIEGMLPTQLLHYLNDFFNQYQPLNQNPNIKSIHQSIPTAIKISKQYDQGIQELSSLLGINKSISDIKIIKKIVDSKATQKNEILTKHRESFSKFIINEIESLLPGSTLLIPSGWTTPEGGHAVYNEIIRKIDPSDQYIFRVFNLGDSSNYQLKLTEFVKNEQMHIQEKIVPYLQLTDLSLSDLCNPIAWEVNYELIARTPHCDIISGKAFIELFLKAIRPDFCAAVEIGEKHLKKQQRSGTCSWKSFVAFCCSKLSPSEWRRLKLDLRLYILNQMHDYFNLIMSPTTYINDEVKEKYIDVSHLVLKGLKKFSRSIQKDYQKNIFKNEEELKNILKLISTLSEQSQAINQKYSKTYSLSFLFQPTFIQSFPRFTTLISPTNSDISSSTIIKPVSFLFPLVKENWKKDIENVHGYLGNCLNQATQMLGDFSNDFNLKAGRYYLESVFADLPTVDPYELDINSSVFWRAIPVDHIPATMKSIVGMSDLLFKVFRTQYKTFEHFPIIHIFYSQKILAIMHQLYHLAADKYMSGFKCHPALCFLTHWIHIHNVPYSSKHPEFVIADPILAKDVEATLAYFLKIPMTNMFGSACGEDLHCYVNACEDPITEEDLTDEPVRPELEFFRNFLATSQGNEIKEILIQKGVQILGVDPQDIKLNMIIALAMSDLTGSLGIPEIFGHLKKQYILAYLTATGTVHDHETTEGNTWSYDIKLSNSEVSLIFSVPGISPSKKVYEVVEGDLPLGHINYTEETYSIVRNKIFSRDPFGTTEDNTGWPEYHSSQFTAKLGANQNKFLFTQIPEDVNQPNGVPLLSVEVFRKIILLGCPDDKSFQPIKVMTYFNQYRNDFDETLEESSCQNRISGHEFRDLCFGLIFEQDFLKKRLLRESNTFHICTNFCWNGFKFFNDQLKTVESLFFLRIGYSIDLILASIGKQERIFSEPFFNSPHEAFETMLKRSDDLLFENLILIYQAQLAYYDEARILHKDSLWEMMPILIRNILKIHDLEIKIKQENTYKNNKQSGFNLSLSERSKEKKYNQSRSGLIKEGALKTTLRMIELLSHLLQDPNQKDFALAQLYRVLKEQFNLAFKIQLPNEFNLEEWDFTHFPHLKTHNGKFFLDLLNGYFQYDGAYSSSLPPDILGNQIFKQLYHNGLNIQNVQLNQNEFYFEDAFKNQCIVSRKKSNVCQDFTFYRIINQKKYAIYFLTIPFIEPLKFNSVHYRGGTQVLQNINPEEQTQYKQHEYYWAKLNLKDTIYPYTSTAWVDETGQELVFIDKKNFQPLTKYTCIDGSVVNCEINSPKYQLQLANKSNFQEFNSFDKYFELWSRHDGQLQVISFPTFKLNFKYNNGIAYSLDFPNFYLLNHWYKDLPRVKWLLVLKNTQSQNDIKVIIPKIAENSSSLTHLPISGNTHGDTVDFHDSHFYIFSEKIINKETPQEIRKLTHRTEEANLYLAYLAILNEKYPLVNEYLQLGVKLSAYTAGEIDIFYMIFNHVTKKNDAIALALALRGAIILFKNFDRHGFKLKPTITPIFKDKIFPPFSLDFLKIWIKDIYHTYTKVNSGAENFALSIEERIFLLGKWPESPERLFLNDNFKGNLTPQIEANRITQHTVPLQLELLSNIGKNDTFFPDKHFTLIAPRYISNHFVSLYKMAQSENPILRKKMRSLIGLTNDIYDIHSPLSAIDFSLRMILEYTADCPAPCLDNSHHFSKLEAALKQPQKVLSELIKSLYKNVVTQLEIDGKLFEQFQSTDLLRAYNSLLGRTLKTKSAASVNIVTTPPPVQTNPTHLPASLFDVIFEEHHLKKSTLYNLSGPIFTEQVLTDGNSHYPFFVHKPKNEIEDELANKEKLYINFSKRLKGMIESEAEAKVQSENINHGLNRVVKKELKRLHVELTHAHQQEEVDRFYFNPHQYAAITIILENEERNLERISSQHIAEIQSLKYKETGIAPSVHLKLTLNRILDKELFSLSDLIPLFQAGITADYQKKFPYLSDDEIKSLHTLIQNELLVQTRLQHIHRIKRILNDINNIPSSTPLQDPYFQLLSRNLYKELTRQRSFSLTETSMEGIQKVAPDLFASLLVIEYYQEILLWPQQINSLITLLVPDPTHRAIVQLKTGSGKSKVFFPILAFKNANGHNLSILMILQELMPGDSRDLQIMNYTMFGQQGHRLDWNNTTLQGLKNIEKELKAIISKKEFLMVTSNEMHLFILRYTAAKLNFQRTSNTSIPALKRIQAFHNVLQILKEKGNMPIDEIDAALFCRFKVNIPFGKAKLILQNRHDLASFLFETLLLDPELSSILHFEFSKNKQLNSQPSTNQTLEKIKPLLIQKCIEKLCKPLSDHLKSQASIQTLSTFFVNLHSNNPEHIEILKYYLLNNPEYHNREDITKEYPPEIQEILALLKEEIKTLWTVNREYRVNYGLSKEFGNILAGPFAGANKPKHKSQFGNYIELIFYTIQAYLLEGVPENILFEYIESLLKNALLAVVSGNARSIAESKSGKAFAALHKASKNYNLGFLSQKEKKEVSQHINSNIQSILTIIREMIISKIKNYHEQLQSNAAMLPDLVYRVQGVTATPTNIETLDDDFKFYPALGTDGQALLAIARNRPHGFFYVDDALLELSENEEKEVPFDQIECSANILSKKKKALKMLRSFLQQSDLETAALIDSGALFKDLKNEEAAAELLTLKVKSSAHIQGVLYFSEEDQLMILKKNGEKYKFQKGEFKSSEYFAFFDQKHTTGVDLVFPPTANAIVTFNKSTILKEILQGAGRLRQLLNGQSIYFMGKASEAIIIKNSLNIDRIPDKIDLLIYFMMNQAQEISSDNVISLKQKMHAVPYKLCREISRQTPIEASTLKHPAFIELEKMFINYWKDIPYEEFGSIDRISPSKEVLNNFKERILNKFLNFIFRYGVYLESKIDSNHFESTPIENEGDAIEGVETKTNGIRSEEYTSIIITPENTESTEIREKREKEEHSVEPKTVLRPHKLHKGEQDAIPMVDSQYIRKLSDHPKINADLNNLVLQLTTKLDAIIEKALEKGNERVPSFIDDSHNENLESTVEQSHEQEQTTENENETQTDLENQQLMTNSRLGMNGDENGLAPADAPPSWMNIHLIFNAQDYFSLQIDGVSTPKRFTMSQSIEFNKTIKSDYLNLLKEEQVFSPHLWLSENYLNTVIKIKDVQINTEAIEKIENKENKEKNEGSWKEIKQVEIVEGLKKYPKFDDTLTKNGMLIKYGEELEFTSQFTQLALPNIPLNFPPSQTATSTHTVTMSQTMDNSMVDEDLRNNSVQNHLTERGEASTPTDNLQNFNPDLFLANEAFSESEMKDEAAPVQTDLPELGEFDFLPHFRGGESNLDIESDSGEDSADESLELNFEDAIKNEQEKNSLCPPEKIYSIFDFYQKNLTTFLVIKPERNQSHFEVVLLSGKEAHDLDEFLYNDKSSSSQFGEQSNKLNVEGRSKQICLYYLGAGIVQQGADPIDAVELENSDQFKLLLVQIKFISKELQYSFIEQQILKAWFRSLKIRTLETLENVFVENALEWEENKYLHYPESDLRKVFMEIRKEKGMAIQILKKRVYPSADEEGEEEIEE